MEKEYETHNQDLHNPHSRHKENLFTKPVIGLMVGVILLLLINQLQINSVTGMITGSSAITKSNGGGDLAEIDISSLKSTAQTVAAVFPIDDIETTNDAIAIMFPTGTPDYGQELGVSYDDPIGSLSILSVMYRGLKSEVQQKNPEAWSRFMNLASQPVGISCEFCCGVGAVGINKQGDSACGCQHNPALLSVALYLTTYTDYTDGEILREVMKWKTLFFPKDMINIGMSIAGGDSSVLTELPGMVGGC